MSRSAVPIRAAGVDEMATAIAIDDDATSLYADAGVALGLTNDNPFAVDEQARWRRSAELGRLFFAMDDAGGPIGIASLDILDGEPYLDQLSVRRSAMRRGVGRGLLHHTFAWARANGDALWLTTYGHLAWNRPFYEREGFAVMPEASWPPGVAHHIAEQRRWLPLPDERVAMRRAL